MPAVVGIILGLLIGLLLTQGSITIGVIGAMFGYLLTTVVKQRSHIFELQVSVKNLSSSIDYLLSRLKTGGRLEQEVNDDENKIDITDSQSGNTTSASTTSDSAVTEQTISQDRQHTDYSPEPDFIASPAYQSTAIHNTATVPERSPVIDTSDNHPANIHQSGPSTWAASEWFGKLITGDNALLRVGLIILFIGLSFLIKYAADQNLFPPGLRVLSVAAGGAILLFIGWRLRKKNLVYSLGMQGAGIAVLYLTTYAALKLYQLMPQTVAFALLILICALGAFLAIVQNSLALAITAAAGGYLAPILVSGGNNQYVILFSYYTLLNFGILGIAWFKAWRPLNAIAFYLTFGVATLWGVERYQDSMFSTVEPFLIIYFLQFSLLAVLYTFRQPPKLKGFVDATLVFGTPLIAFSLQSAMVVDFRYGLAWSSAIAATWYLTLAMFVRIKDDVSCRLFSDALLALAILFATLTIPFALDGRWTSAAWAIEGCALIWVGLRQQQAIARLFGMGLQLLSGVAFVVYLGWTSEQLPYLFQLFLSAPAGQWPVLNHEYIACLIIFVGGIISSQLLRNNPEQAGPIHHPLHIPLLVWGVVWWVIGGASEISSFVSAQHLYQSEVLFIGLTGFLAWFAGKALRWPQLQAVAYALPAALVIGFFDRQSLLTHPGHELGYLMWVLLFAGYYLVLYSKDKAHNPDNSSILHSLPWLTLGAILSLEIVWVVQHLEISSADQLTWNFILPGLLLSCMLLAAVFIARRKKWPGLATDDAYIFYVPLTISTVLLVWSAAANVMLNGQVANLSYIPFLNILDITQIVIFGSVTYWLKQLDSHQEQKLFAPQVVAMPYIVAAIMFAWLNAILLRSLHHWTGIDYNLDTMFDSVLVQSALSVFWSLLALIVMVWSNQRKLRITWLVGAGLLAVTVLKLFTIDLASSGTIARIVSFVSVGVLLLVIAWFSPLPPRQDDNDSSDNSDT